MHHIWTSKIAEEFELKKHTATQLWTLKKIKKDYITLVYVILNSKFIAITWNLKWENRTLKHFGSKSTNSHYKSCS